MTPPNVSAGVVGAARAESLSSVPFTAVSFEDNFWLERLETVLTRTIPSQYAKLDEHGILDSLRLPQPPPPLRIPVGSHGMSTQVFWDSDVGKWIEAASYALHFRRDPAIEEQIDAIVEQLAAAQLPDGYLNCWYLGREPDQRWTNLRDRHELYCAGHLLEGAIAYFQATGRRRLLDVMERYVEHIRTVLGRGPGQKRGYCGHPEIELALVRLYRLTGEREPLELAAYFIDERGRQPHYYDIEAAARGDDPKTYWFKTYEYSQSHKPVREQDKVVGHAVRAMYLYAAMADLAAENGDATLSVACERLWRDLTERRIYITGGVGSARANEGFTADYDLPNHTAYAETCAAIALILWASRMLNLACDGTYADVMERALYNAALAGLSRDGTRYFYDNPLESDGGHRRWAWHHCPCCTMNVARLIASVGGYFYSSGESTLAVHLYGGNSAAVTVGGKAVRVTQQTDYPWSGEIRIALEVEAPIHLTLKLRIPGWAPSAALAINGERLEPPRERGYAVIRRRWRSGDVIQLDLPMPVERLYAHPDVGADVGRVCLMRGPLVYCLEAVDNPSIAIRRARMPRDTVPVAVERPDLFDGIVAIDADGGVARADGWEGALYRNRPTALEPARLTFIPFFLWASREPGAMVVWLTEC